MALNNTSKLIGLDEHAAKIELDLNTLASDMFDGTVIGDTGSATGEVETVSQIVFNLTADAQEYNIKTTTTNDASEVTYPTVGILERIDLNVTPDPYMSMYNEAYALTLYGYYDEMEDVRKILDKYTMEQKGLWVEQNSWLIRKSVQSTDYAAPIDENTDRDRFMSTTILLYSFLDGGIHSSKVVIEVDSVRIPFYSVSVSTQKELISIPYANSDSIVSFPKTQATSYNLSFPVLDNVPLKKIAKEIAEATWGNTYTIDINDGVVDTGSINVILSDGNYSIEQDGIVVVEATFVLYNEVI